MEFLQSLLLSIGSLFGLYAEPAPELVSIPESAMVKEATSTNTTTAAAEAPEPVVATAIDRSTTPVIAETAVEESAPTALSTETESKAGETKPVITEAPAAAQADIRTMIVAGGCFWCVEADLEKVSGVRSVVSGYSGGSTANPTYSDYGSGGHREVVEVTYDANQVSYEDILIITMKTTDPTDDDGTFADRGDKYSSAFYYETDEQKAIIENLIQEVNEFGPYTEPLAIDVEERATFWPAEEYHQDYYKGTLSRAKYGYYRNASGRDDFIEQYWSSPRSPNLSWRTNQSEASITGDNFWTMYQKPSKEELKTQLSDLAYKVTQEDGTERAGTSPLDKEWGDGIYVDILSGEPLFSSKDKFDSGTGWPSFVKPITPEAVTEHDDRGLFSVRTEIRSAIADNHLGHVFTDGPADRGGLRYCMNGVALRFVPKDQMETQGYEEYLQYL